MRELAGAAAERERTDAADRAGVTVRHRVGGAGQHDAELGRNNVGYALFRIVDVEQPDAVAAAALAHRLDEGGSGRVGVVVATRFGCHRMILHRKGEVGAAYRPALLSQLREGVMSVQLVQDMAIDIDEIAAIGALRDAMKIPYFVE